jgi:hypothetical protein
MKYRRRRISLSENVFRLGRPERVDRAAGRLRGVKILGLRSDNNRVYLPAAVAQAAPLYEGCKIYLNHPKRADDPRDVRDTFGWFENVRVARDGGLVGDLCVLNPASEVAELVFSAAEKNSQIIGISHNAEGNGRHDSNGTFVVEVIERVRSCDLVCDPATVNGLFESRQKLRRAIKESRKRPRFPHVTDGKSFAEAVKRW